MASFTDATGRTWAVNIDVTTIRRLRSALDVNLLDMVEDEGKLLAQLLTDPVLLVDMIYVICKPQADQHNLTDEDFGRALVGDAIDRATDALLEALSAFFPSQRGALLRRLVEKTRQTMALAYQVANKQLDGLEITEADIVSRLGSLSTKSPGSAE